MHLPFLCTRRHRGRCLGSPSRHPAAERTQIPNALVWLRLVWWTVSDCALRLGKRGPTSIKIGGGCLGVF